MISSVLDFNAQEADKVGLNKQQSSWLGSILGGGSAPTTGSGEILRLEGIQTHINEYLLLQDPHVAMTTWCRPLFSSWSRSHSRWRNCNRDPHCWACRVRWMGPRPPPQPPPPLPPPLPALFPCRRMHKSPVRRLWQVSRIQRLQEHRQWVDHHNRWPWAPTNSHPHATPARYWRTSSATPDCCRKSIILLSSRVFFIE